MLIPLRTDRPPKRRPVVTEGLILVNLLVYLLGAAGAYFGLFADPDALASFGHFDPRSFTWWQLVTYQFLHDPYGIWHIAFNMLFLWVFGAAVEDRLGRLGFVGFYLIGGAVAALAHSMLNAAPVIGASGSIAGVTGAFLALFPRSRIRILLFFFVIGVYNIPAVWFIAFYMGIDLLRQVGEILGRGGSNVAYLAHIAGYAYGFGVGFLLLATGVLKHEEFDVFYLFTQARRRRAFRAAGREAPAGLWSAPQADTAQRLKKQAERRPAPTAEETRRAKLRAEINKLLATGNVGEAARRYRDLLADVPPQRSAANDADVASTVLGERGQLDVASQLFAEGEHADAARAYELLIQNYPLSANADEVRLMLGLLYARHLDLPRRARELIEAARPRLRDAGQTRLADQLLAELAT